MPTTTAVPIDLDEVALDAEDRDGGPSNLALIIVLAITGALLAGSGVVMGRVVAKRS